MHTRVQGCRLRELLERAVKVIAAQLERALHLCAAEAHLDQLLAPRCSGSLARHLLWPRRWLGRRVDIDSDG